MRPLNTPTVLFLPDMKSLLQAQHIVKQYANHTALNDVSIDVQHGRIFGLLGPNGAGKTSLIRIINQITGPDGGEVFLDGEPLRPDHIKDIGYLPEERGLYKKMKVGEQAMYLAQLKGLSRKDAYAALRQWFTRFDIAEWWNKKVEELSKGMAQKVQFIVTVVHKPKLLILDEPFSGFDPINTNLIKDEIMSLREQGATVIFSTHNMASVEEICDDIALINRGRVILDGSMKDVKAAYRNNTYNIEFTGEMIGFTNALWTGFELLDRAELEKGHYKATVRLLNDHTVNQLLQTIVPVCEVQRLNPVEPSMNDIFIQKVTEMGLEPEETPNTTEA